MNCKSSSKTGLCISTHPNVLQKNVASTLVLQTHQLLSMFTLLFGLCVEKLYNIWKGFIIPIKIVCLQDIKKRRQKLFYIVELNGTPTTVSSEL